MRFRFDPQLRIGCLPIEKTEISLKLKDSLTELLAALLEIYKNKEYKNKIFSVLEYYINSGKKRTGRPGMSLWELFVLAQVKLCQNISYEDLHALANNHLTLRSLLGIGALNGGFTRIEYGYQNIYDNVNLLTENILKEIQDLIVEFGHKEVFKKKGKTALRLKSDSFVVESNVHFPTDYNLLWDSVRKSIDMLSKFLKKYKNISGWRKLSDWRTSLKGLMRALGKVSSSGGSNKKERQKQAAKLYTVKARSLLLKLKKTLPDLPISDQKDLATIMSLEYFMEFLSKHIDLVERRLIKGESIAHDEKIFSIFETYTEWINKGKPYVELGKKVCITTDQYHLIIDYQIMEKQQDRDIVLRIADRLLAKFKIASWSFDKGFWNKDNKAILSLEVEKVIMPKLGKKTKKEEIEENTSSFKKLKNRHSTIESNINELEHRGLDRCPNRGFLHFKAYVGMAICAYNLKKIGKELLAIQRKKQKEKQKGFKIAA